MIPAAHFGLSDLAAVTDRETTAALVEIATVIAAGKAASVITAAAPPFLRTVFPYITAAEHARVARLLAWAMYCQHGATTTAISRKLKTAKAIGANEADATAAALATAKALTAAIIHSFAQPKEAKPTTKPIHQVTCVFAGKASAPGA